MTPNSPRRPPARDIQPVGAARRRRSMRQSGKWAIVSHGDQPVTRIDRRRRRRAPGETPMKPGLLFGIVAALLLTAGAAPAQQAPAGYPSRQVRLVVPYPSGGPTDLIGRILAQKLGERL